VKWLLVTLVADGQRCKTGGHECIFEESNRGKRSTRKNEALTAKLSKMEAALKGIGAVSRCNVRPTSADTQALSNLDQPSLNSFSTALHGVTSDPELINVITSHTAPSAVPTLAVAMNRSHYSGSADTHYDMRGEDSAHNALLTQPPLSPRLHSLPDNVLSPLGLLAEASLQNTDGKKVPGAYGKMHRPSPLSLDGRGGHGRAGSASANYRMATSDVRGGADNDDDAVGRGVASQNYFRPGASAASAVGGPDNRVSTRRYQGASKLTIRCLNCLQSYREKRSTNCLRSSSITWPLMFP